MFDFKVNVDHLCFDGFDNAFTAAVVTARKLNVFFVVKFEDGFVFTVVWLENTGNKACGTNVIGFND